MGRRVSAIRLSARLEYCTHLTDFFTGVVLTIYFSTKLSGEKVLNTIFAAGNTKPLKALRECGGREFAVKTDSLILTCTDFSGEVPKVPIMM